MAIASAPDAPARIDIQQRVPPPATMLDMFRRMMLIKVCDERLRATIKAGRIAAPHYSPRGQEAISAAVAVNLEPGDFLITIYRGLHDHLAKGVPVKELIAEYAGRSSGACKGKGGPMHITHPESGVIVTTGIVGSGIPIANGLGWASQLRQDGRVTVTNFGDGASNIGAFHEALNLAALWKLPVIFVCHNNGYAEHTRYDLGTASATIAQRAQSYGMRGVRVDGNDPLAMWAVVKDAVADARAGNGPTLIEAMTFRFNGHNFGDPADYISKQEMEEAIARDPIPRYRAALIERGVADETRLGAMEAEIGAEIDQAIEFALASPFPTADELHRDVYAEEVEP
jgi:pyruvate dehydrogenase E1 component alpha subunit